MTLDRFFEIGAPIRMNVVAGRLQYNKRLPLIHYTVHNALDVIGYLATDLKILAENLERSPDAVGLDQLQECVRVLKDDRTRTAIIKRLMLVSELKHQKSPEVPLYTYDENEQVMKGILRYIETYCETENNAAAIGKLKEFLSHTPE